MWNTTTANGATITYNIQHNDLNQNNATFVVRVGQPGGAGCAEIDTTVLPHVITVSATLLNRPQEDIRSAIAHEIGHRLGLAEARQGGTCGSANTIMRGGTTACDMVATSVTSADVAQVNRTDFQQSTCTQPQPQNAVVETDSDGGGDDGGGDPCGGDPCCGDPCCGDPTCYQECYIVCETYCSGCEAIDPYDPDECMWWGYCDTSCYQVCN
jgi:hypothetical protein